MEEINARNYLDEYDIINSTLQQIIKATAEVATTTVLACLLKNVGGMHLDNSIQEYASPCEKETNCMAKRQKFEIILENGERAWLTGKTISEAFNNGLKRFGGNLVHRQSSEITFATFSEKWFELYKTPKHRQTTLRTYRSLLDKHILPYFGAMTFNQVTTNSIQHFFTQKSEMSKSSVKQMKILLHEICQAAIEDGYLTKDPTNSSRLTLPTKKKTREALSTECLVDILHNMHKLKDQDALLLAMFCYTGMRRGEVLGLKWEDITGDMIHVQRSVTFKGNKPVVGPPKSKAGIRCIPVVDQMKQFLNSPGNGYIIGNGDEPITESKFDRTWERIGKTINLYGATTHVFRHTYLTLLGATDTNVKTIQAIAGHADIQTTMNRYVHSRHEDILSAGAAFTKLTSSLTATKTPEALIYNSLKPVTLTENGHKS